MAGVGKVREKKREEGQGVKSSGCSGKSGQDGRGNERKLKKGGGKREAGVFIDERQAKCAKS